MSLCHFFTEALTVNATAYIYFSSAMVNPWNERTAHGRWRLFQRHYIIAMTQELLTEIFFDSVTFPNMLLHGFYVRLLIVSLNPRTRLTQHLRGARSLIFLV